jgi:hypothetical protein
MEMNQKLLGILTGVGLLFFLCVSAQPALAADFDGSKPLVCAMITAFECGPDSGCESGTPESNGLSRFLRIDFDKKEICTTKSAEEQTSSIEKTERAGGLVLLSGTKNGRGWNLSITEATGYLVLTVAGDQVAFVVFGACTPP